MGGRREREREEVKEGRGKNEGRRKKGKEGKEKKGREGEGRRVSLKPKFINTRSSKPSCGCS